ncbi:MAG: PQQ-binding-like beta-propeller repeat protein [Kiritimatiellae bacterium]|nr:PQQ-binding-like beta-propeller repeat protein [Kiritimatiellia bacterium]MDD5523336.1 PQQ-binding-like beta-propeller repeat protein [Kiritimatiellia bacterium]
MKYISPILLIRLQLLFVVVITGIAVNAGANDWPTYRHDISRSGITQEKLATPLIESWVYKSIHVPVPAWEPSRDVPVEGILELPRVRFDDAYHVVSAGDSLYFGSSADNKVYCLDAKSGKIRWTFFTGGSVRLSPTIYQKKIYVGSDDGYVYCLDTLDGHVIWQRRVGPGDQRLLGRGRMISMWPIRTDVLVNDGMAFYGAGIFPSEGVYIEAVNANSGQLVWRNDTGGEATDSRMSPQGYLLATSTNLFVPQGRVSPSAFDRKKGNRVYDSGFGKYVGGTFAFISGNTLFNGTEEILGYDAVTRTKVAWFEGRKVIIVEDTAYLTSSNSMMAVNREVYPKWSVIRFNVRDQKVRISSEISVANKEKKRLTTVIEHNNQELKKIDKLLSALPDNDPKRVALETTRSIFTNKTDETALVAVDQKLEGIRKRLNDLNQQSEDAYKEMQSCVKWRLSCECPDSLILAGDVLFAGGQDQVIAVNTVTGEKVWECKVNGKAKGLTVANGRLFVSTDTGAIHCFAAATKRVRFSRLLGISSGSPNTAQPELEPYPRDSLSAAYVTAAETIVNETGIKRGFCLVLGCETGRLAFELAKRTEMQIIGIEPDAQKVAAARKALDAAGLYGKRVTVDQGNLDHLPYASYFANLIVSDAAILGRMVNCPAREVFRVLKPLGGRIIIGQPAEASGSMSSLTPAILKQFLANSDMPEPQVIDARGVWAKVTRGPLPGAGRWTHEYANEGNTACSDDRFVKCPLGLLWFGDPGPLQMVSRHRRAAAPLSVNGILFIQSENAVSAYDAYNGLKLWDVNIPNVVRTGVSDESSNLAADEKNIYVVNSNKCFCIDAVTGVVKATCVVPQADDGKYRSWGHLAVSDGILLGTAGITNTRTADIMFAYDTATGKIRWTHTGDIIQHTTISIDKGCVFFTDTGVAPVSDKQKITVTSVKSPAPTAKRQLPVRNVMALKLSTGQVVWKKQLDLTGCVGGSYWGSLGSMVHDGVLVFFGVYTDGHYWKDFFARQFDQRRVIAFSAKDGEQLWARNIAYRVRPIIIGDTFHAEPWAFDLKTGEQRTRINPITRLAEPWQFARPGHHCGCPVASPNVMAFRSFYLGYYDLVGDYGVTTFGSIRPGCWINFILANGLLMVPEASSGCMCPLPNMCTVVLAPREENRAWGKYSLIGDITPVNHLAINFGAPGDRKDSSGTLWLGYPRQLGSLVLQFKLNVSMLPRGGYFAKSSDSIRIENTSSPWLYTFGVCGLRSCQIPLLNSGEAAARYTVRLGFAEIDEAKSGDRIFDIKLQGKPMLKQFDVVKEAGGVCKAIVKEFRGVDVESNLDIEFVPKTKQPDPSRAPILQTVEIIRETSL